MAKQHETDEENPIGRKHARNLVTACPKTVAERRCLEEIAAERDERRKRICKTRLAGHYTTEEASAAAQVRNAESGKMALSNLANGL